ncbi:hypothetical protein [Amycolatopsis minnesotensis]|uniref:hypothetical protein n=1 Tax=Amycolatopsis minnesotensis TaxID=337894 RepID=UPI0031CF6B01
MFYDTVTLDGGTIRDNAAGEPGTGSYPSPASAGGIYINGGHVTLTNSAVVTAAQNRQAEDLAAAARAAMPTR